MTIRKTKLQSIAEQILQEEQHSFHKGRSCTDTLVIIRQILKKSEEYNLPLFFLFLDYDKTYSRVNEGKLWAILIGCALWTDLVNAIKSLQH
jgi:hypothetical protein